MTLLLVDAAGLYFRAFHSVPISVTSPDGRPVNAIRGFLEMSASIIDQRRPARYLACLDADWRPAFRTALLPAYKAQRANPDGTEQVPEELSGQVPLLVELLGALGLATAGAAGFEADDVIATAALRSRAPVEVLTGDRDLFALASARVTILYTGRGFAKLAPIGPPEVIDQYGVTPEHYPDLAALRGDPSDGLPGVPGVGAKTAALLVGRFGTVRQILAAAEAGDEGVPAGVRAKVLAHADYLRRADEVVRLRTDVPLAEVDDTLPRLAADPDRVTQLAADLGVQAPVRRLQAAIAAATGTA